jgi:phage antirepressor YoqD-like protein
MNELELFARTMSQMMTVKQVAGALGVHPDTVNSWVKKLYPDLPRNGVPTMLDEAQVTSIKLGIESSGRNDLRNVTELQNVHTDLEMKQKAAEVISWLSSETDRLRLELTAAQPKVDGFDALMRSDRTMSITDAAKHFGLHPKTQVFSYLRARGYLTLSDLPTQAAIDQNYLALRESRSAEGKCYPQAVVLASQLETWRKRVVPQILGQVDG